MPPDLLEFQRDFAAALDEAAEGAMAVYRNTVLHGVAEALRANFPVIEQIVGSEMFSAIAVDFAAECPPRRPVLALYGERFADWIEGQPWVADLPYLPDVARIERLHLDSLMAADAKALREPLAREACGLPLIRLRLHPATRFSWLSTPAMTIWLAHQHGFEGELQPDWAAEGALFVRPDSHIVRAQKIDRAAHRLLFGIRLGESLNEAMTSVGRLYPTADRAAILASLVNLGAFAAPAPGRITQ